MTCAHFDPSSTCCEMGVVYLKLAGGGPHNMVMRLPCLPISNRRGEEGRPCAQFAPITGGKPA